MSEIDNLSSPGWVNGGFSYFPSGISIVIEEVIKAVTSLFSNKSDSSAIHSGILVESSPRAIKKGIELNPEYVIAPSLKAVENVKRKVKGQGGEHVEAILHSILQAEDLAHALYERRSEYTKKPDELKIKIRTYQDNGKVAADILYSVRRVDTPEGLNAFILVPQEVPEEVTPEVKMIFVGTKDIEGVVRDAEDGAPGNESFKKYEDRLLTELNEAVGKLKSADTVKISVIGHSLGGADAQRMIAKITESMIDDSSMDPTLRPDQVMIAEAAGIINIDYCSNLRNKNITLSLETSAAPALTKTQCDKFTLNLQEAVKRKEKSFKFRATESIYKLDVVPTFGERNIIANNAVLSCCEQVNVVYIKSKPFQHESEIFKNSEDIAEGDLKILQIGKECDKENEEKTKLDMIDVLSRSSGIDRWRFIKVIKKAFIDIAVDRGWIDYKFYDIANEVENQEKDPPVSPIKKAGNWYDSPLI